MAVATVGGPLLGGLLVDTSWLGWRWCFYVGVPFAVAALVLLQRTLHLPVTEARGAHRLPRRGLPDRRRLRAADLGDAGRERASPGSRPSRRCSSAAACSRSSPSCVTETAGEGADRPAAPVPRPDDDAGHHRQRGGRCRDVRRRRSSSASTCRSRAATRRPRPACSPSRWSPGCCSSSTVSGILITRTGRWKALPGGRRVLVVAGLRAALDHRPRDGHGAARRLPLRARRRHRHDDAEPRAGRAEHRRRVRTSAPPARRSPSSAASAARSASRCWARC